MSQKTIRPFHIFQKALKRFLKVIYCTQQLQVRENVVGFKMALGAVKVIKDQIQYRSQSLLNLARDYLRPTLVPLALAFGLSTVCLLDFGRVLFQ